MSRAPEEPTHNSMSKLIRDKRILALDIRPRSFGFVVLEGPDRLLDWGARSFRKGVNAVQVPPRKKLASMLAEFSPEIVLLNKRLLETLKMKHGMVGIARVEANKRKIPVRAITRPTVKRAFAMHNRNKDQIARALADRFPELAVILPPNRRCWQSEDYRMSVFDAAALAVAYFSRGKSATPAGRSSVPAPPVQN